MKRLLVAVLVSAAIVLPALPSMAADMPDAAPAPEAKLSAKCFFLPLLPDCLTEWKAHNEAMLAKMAPKKAAMAKAK